MIVTKEWLNEWCDLSEVSTEKICESLNSIGLEVESLKSIKIPKKVVVGKVLSCSKHPDANKLSVTQVDVGNEVLQIVCGAKNVAADQFVPVAINGAVLGKDFKIKKAKLRGVQSNGMICSSSEIGLGEIGDGILVLDDSIGELELGKELCEYPLINDDIIEIELTANRGDCLSVYGVARDLSCALELDLKEFTADFKEDQRGVARILKLKCDENVNSCVKLKFLEIKHLNLPLLYKFRLAQIGNDKKDDILKFIDYASHTIGVLMCGYDFDKSKQNDSKEITLSFKQNKNSLDEILNESGKTLSTIGLNHNENYLPDDRSKKIIIEASYIDPEVISSKQHSQKLNVDESFYKSSRGSSLYLNFGMNYLCSIISASSEVSIYSGLQNHIVEKEDLKIKLDFDFFESFIGQKLSDKKIIEILSKLGFEINNSIATIPQFRHDIKNSQDIVEEIVRIYGIDNIISKPMEFFEARQLNESFKEYKKSIFFKAQSVGLGYFETVHYCFDSLESIKKYNLPTVEADKDLLNPITNDLNTLRSTLLLHLIRSCSKNTKLGKKKIKLFEQGRVFDKDREEFEKIAFLFSGDIEDAKPSNHAKPSIVDFFKFAEDISSIVGHIELKNAKDENSLVSPYEYARVFINSCDIGFIGRVHAKIEEEFSLAKTYICELDFKKLSHDMKIVKSYSKFPSLTRDISVLVPKDMLFSKVENSLHDNLPKEVINYFPIDIFESDELGDNHSLTIRFILQSSEKTLNDEDITKIMDDILALLKDKLDIGLR